MTAVMSNSSGRGILPPPDAVVTWMKAADTAAILIAAALPWSTTLVAVFVVAWLIALAPTIKVHDFMDLFRRPACLLPVVFFVLAVLGLLWSEAPWHDRLYGIGPMAKLLAIPLLIYHFQRSARGMWIFAAFLASCTILMCMSWLVAFDPRWALKKDAEYGVPVKNYIDQSQEFALCAVALAWPILKTIRTRHYGPAVAYVVLAAAFLVNMMYVTVSRTTLVAMPVMLVAFAAFHLRRRGTVTAVVVLALAVGALWFVAPNLRMRTQAAISEYQQYHDANAASSVGLRLEFWRKSLRFLAEEPVLGHGTGSIRTMFARSAKGQTGASAEIINNPHNQTLNVAVQWGIVGVVILYAMWIAHLLLFRGGHGLPVWVGLLVVVQNVVSSLFNSHLADFNEGWMYVLGVGIAGGIVLRGSGTSKAEADVPGRAKGIPAQDG
ncbi:MAG TPA: O-antigen ligase family protein [Nitrobacter sp.]|nr:O-antigen ligase family protein [Nitrobacter sp.]